MGLRDIILWLPSRRSKFLLKIVASVNKATILIYITIDEDLVIKVCKLL